MERVRFNSPVDRMPDAIDEKKSRVLKDIDALFEVGSLSPDVLLDVLEQLKIVPHVRMGETLDARETAEQHLIRMDMFREASMSARTNVYNAWCSSAWDRQHQANCMVIDETRPTDGEVIEDGCAICGVVKTLCLEREKHFGAKAESPPYKKCKLCTYNFGNCYDSAKRLALHVATKH
jgi:hypothetical protein